MNNRRNNKILKNFKDYLVPIVIIFIIFVFVLNYIFSKETEIKTIDNTSFLSLSLNSPDTEAYVFYSWWNKTKIDSNTSLYKSEKIQVVNGSVNIKNDSGEFVLNRLWEFTYNEDGNFTLYSSDLWVKSNSINNFEMRYAKVTWNSWSIFSLSQNEVASTIYVVSGNVEVKNLAWKSTTLSKWEKIVIMRNSAKDENSDLSLSKETIDDYIKKDDWFLKNSWDIYLSNTEINSSWALISTWNSNTTLNNGFSYISFSNIYDESEVNSDTLNIEWNILDEVVSKIEINWVLAEISSQTKTFIVKNIKLNSKINDLVYKIYDNSSRLLNKWVITLHYSKWTTTETQTTSWLAWVENYPITTSPLYQIISPKQNPYTTTENIVRIEWTVPPRTVEKIIVNDFQLQKFPAYSSYWSYFANSEFGNLKPGINIYKIKYFWSEWKLLYENNFTIIKQEVKITENVDNTQTSNSTSTWDVIWE